MPDGCVTTPKLLFPEDYCPIRSLNPAGLIVTHIYASRCHSEHSKESLSKCETTKTTAILRYAQDANGLVRNDEPFGRGFFLAGASCPAAF